MTPLDKIMLSFALLMLCGTLVLCDYMETKTAGKRFEIVSNWHQVDK